ncbi:hypothetical protein BCR34DRAFT_620671 [Clohesyomyces aquaticus]|uniref:Uncharacterized protein n=1 Tax=Clohesyomyces aquaticus TaxID=1231657 RepID=A0A1Y1XY98_9PLEO|nr:hypothetical protein BCR34DRAFT_620671 [Clohesyomyces aquaticus]
MANQPSPILSKARSHPLNPVDSTISGMLIPNRLTWRKDYSTIIPRTLTWTKQEKTRFSMRKRFEILHNPTRSKLMTQSTTPTANPNPAQGGSMAVEKLNEFFRNAEPQRVETVRVIFDGTGRLRDLSEDGGDSSGSGSVSQSTLYPVTPIPVFERLLLEYFFPALCDCLRNQLGPKWYSIRSFSCNDKAPKKSQKQDIIRRFCSPLQLDIRVVRD